MAGRGITRPSGPRAQRNRSDLPADMVETIIRVNLKNRARTARYGCQHRQSCRVSRQCWSDRKGGRERAQRAAAAEKSTKPSHRVNSKQAGLLSLLRQPGGASGTSIKSRTLCWSGALSRWSHRKSAMATGAITSSPANRASRHPNPISASRRLPDHDAAVDKTCGDRSRSQPRAFPHHRRASAAMAGDVRRRPTFGSEQGHAGVVLNSWVIDTNETPRRARRMPPLGFGRRSSGR